MEVTRGKIARAQRVVVYGSEGVGKTTFASQFPSPVFIDTEGGSGHLDVDRLPAPTSWTKLLETVRWIKDNPAGYLTLVLDTADWAERLAAEHICASHQLKGIEDFSYGKGYVFLAEEFGRLLNLLGDVVESGINVVVVAHAVMRKVEQPEQIGAYDHWELKLQKKTAPMVKEWADMVLFANYKTIVVSKDGKNKAQGGQRRVMYTQHSAAWDAKNRHGLSDELPFEFSAIASAIPMPLSLPAPQSVAVQSVPAATPTPTPAQAAPATKTVYLEDKGSHFVAYPDEAPKAEMTVYEDDKQVKTEERIEFMKAGDPRLPKHLKPLYDLLEGADMNTMQFCLAVEKKGYMAKGTPLEKYDPEFIAGWGVAMWPQVKEFIQTEIMPYGKDLATLGL